MSQSIRRALYREKGLPDPGPTPSAEMSQLTILLERDLVKKIDELADFLATQYPSRNDLLVELLKEGLRSAAQAAAEAAAAVEAARNPTPDIAVARPAEVEITNPGLSIEQRQEMSAKLRALKGQG